MCVKEEQTMKKTTLMLLALIVLSLFFVSGIAEKTEYVKKPVFTEKNARRIFLPV